MGGGGDDDDDADDDCRMNYYEAVAAWGEFRVIYSRSWVNDKD